MRGHSGAGAHLPAVMVLIAHDDKPLNLEQRVAAILVLDKQEL